MLYAKYNSLKFQVLPDTGEIVITTDSPEQRSHTLTTEDQEELFDFLRREQERRQRKAFDKLPWYRKIFATVK